MHNKKYNKTQNFIQGLRPFSSSVPRELKKMLKKGGYNFSNIVDNWTKMVGKHTSDACYPSKIKTSKENINGTLILNVIHGKELEVEYAKKDIIDKINSFFGYSVIEKLKFISFDDDQNIFSTDTKKRKNVTIKKYQTKINSIKNEKIKKSLIELTKVFKQK